MQPNRTKANKNKTGKRRNRNSKRGGKRRTSAEAASQAGSTDNSCAAAGPKVATGNYRRVKKQVETDTMLGMQMWRQTYETALQWHQAHQLNFWRQHAVSLEQENDSLKKRSIASPLRPSKHAQLKKYETSDSESELEEELRTQKQSQRTVKPQNVASYEETDDEDDDEEFEGEDYDDEVEGDKYMLPSARMARNERQRPHQEESFTNIDAEFLDFLTVTHNHRQELQRARDLLNI